jgi:hypothetical protein
MGSPVSIRVAPSPPGKKCEEAHKPALHRTLVVGRERAELERHQEDQRRAFQESRTVSFL